MRPAHPHGSNDEPHVDFNDVFSLRKPKDFKAGLSSGLKSITKGVVGGATTLIAAPVAGAVQDGVAGFAKGLVAGVVGAVALPLTGISIGCAQIVRGGVNQVEAVNEGSKGKVWDQSLREWTDKPTNALANIEDSSAWRNFKRDHIPPSTEAGADYYELLQVPRTASPEQIKKAYYGLARKWHPDKNPDNPEAHERFQKLGQAYQVLCNDELRQRYDARGQEGVDGVNFMESGEFFSMLFGCEQFEHLIGELVLASSARMGPELNTDQLRGSQVERVEKLVVNLKALLLRYEAGDVEGFKLSMQEEAEKLVAASFGDTMLHTIGKVYEGQADIYLGGFFDGTLAKFRHGRETFRNQVTALGAAVKVMKAQQKMEAWERKREEEAVKLKIEELRAQLAAHRMGDDGLMPEEAGGSSTSAGAATKSAEEVLAEDMIRQQMEEDALPLMLEAMWAANVLDIQGTVARVCKQVLQEKGVAKEVLRLRATALKEAGVIFQAVQPRQVAGPTRDAKQQMEDAMMRVIEKRHAQDAAMYEDPAPSASARP